ncbi:MAG: STAS-like domain-containing protein, partial [Lachnospiraceae bacterium]|nr:STAS-like domain-containing protein [Lachnospiraceae bacterium]
DKFTEVELDFSGVEKIGQGFAHELFVVYQNEHPTIRLLPINQNETVARMIQHVLR